MHLAELKDRHQALEAEMAEARSHPLIDDLKIIELKRRKLAGEGRNCTPTELQVCGRRSSRRSILGEPEPSQSLLQPPSPRSWLCGAAGNGKTVLRLQAVCGSSALHAKHGTTSKVDHFSASYVVAAGSKWLTVLAGRWSRLRSLQGEAPATIGASRGATASGRAAERVRGRKACGKIRRKAARWHSLRFC